MAVQQTHVYRGGSTEGIVDAGKVLREAGLCRGDVLLDAGAGSGYLALAAAEVVGSKGGVYALDARPEAMAGLANTARIRGLDNLVTLVADMAVRIPLGDGTVDVCVANSVLHDLVEDGTSEPALAELARVLRQGAAFTVVEFRTNGELAIGPPLAIRLAPEQVARIVSPHGFQKRSAFSAGPQHYGLVFAKPGARM